MQNLISYNQYDHYFYGNTELLDYLDNVSSICGIPNSQLFHLVLKEYQSKRDVYNYKHNAPWLLKAKALHIANELCNMYTVPTRENEISEMLSIDVFKKQAHRFPMYPQHHHDYLIELLVHTLEFRKDLDLRGESYNYDIMNHAHVKAFALSIKIKYYSNWDYFLMNHQEWFQLCIEQLVNLHDKLDADSMMMELIVHQINERLQNRTKVIPATVYGSKVSWWHKLKLKMKGLNYGVN